MENNRKPVYGPNHNWRIVSRPGGLWRVEKRVADHGSRERDCWEPTSSDSGKDDALRLLAKE
jgi:hypothetical protein